MNGRQEQHIARRARRWTRTAGRRLTLAGWLVACLLLASVATVAASAHPTPGGLSDGFGRDHWSGWSVRPPIADPDSRIRLDRQPPDIQVTVTPMVGPYPMGSEVRVDFLCSDSGSGIRWCPSQVTLDTRFPGYHSVSFYAVDVAGNVASTAVTFVVLACCSTPMIVFPAPGGVWV
jgi:hypothetical protein